MIKESELDLSVDSENRICRYYKMYYEELIDYLILNIVKKFENTKTIPPTLNAKNKTAESIPIVLAGGTSSPKGFAEMFRDRVEKSNFPFKVDSIIVTQDPLYSVAKGLLQYALNS
jgi:imidazole glycerol phosphate synthase subunit HisF